MTFTFFEASCKIELHEARVSRPPLASVILTRERAPSAPAET